jgi:hypothetical protein
VAIASAPYLKSSVPNRDSTLSGLVMDGRACSRGLSGGVVPANENRRGKDCRRHRELTMDDFRDDDPQGAICYDGVARKDSPEKISSFAGPSSMGTNPQCASMQP